MPPIIIRYWCINFEFVILGHSDMNNFCSRKLKTMAMNKHKTDGLHGKYSEKRTMWHDIFVGV